MQDDTAEHNPGRAEFWEEFYAEDGRLQSKEWEHRRANELKENGSLKDHYEWFMLYPSYEESLTACVLTLLRQPAGLRNGNQPLRVLHIGCGNSDLCDHLHSTVDSLVRRPEFDDLSSSSLAYLLRQESATCTEILNVDICASLVTHLASRFPQRLYAVGNCCDLARDPLMAAGEGCPTTCPWYWFKTESQNDGVHVHLEGVARSSTDLVCDKGTLDALMSAFAGDFNPNVEAYANEMLAVLRPGGSLFIVSINAEDVVCSYLLAAHDVEDECKGFRLASTSHVELCTEELRLLRVETLGSRYNCYTFVVERD